MCGAFWRQTLLDLDRYPRLQCRRLCFSVGAASNVELKVSTIGRHNQAASNHQWWPIRAIIKWSNCWIHILTAWFPSETQQNIQYSIVQYITAPVSCWVLGKKLLRIQYSTVKICFENQAFTAGSCFCPAESRVHSATPTTFSKRMIAGFVWRAASLTPPWYVAPEQPMPDL